MKNLKQSEADFVSGGACVTYVTAVSREANAYIEQMPKPRSGTCAIEGDINIPGFSNSGIIRGEKGVSIQSGGIKFVCKCSENYPEDIFEVYPYGREDL